MLAAKKLGVDEVIFVDPAGNILEANRSNVIAVIDGELVTPPNEANLDGVTRGAMLEAAAHSGLSIREASLPLDSVFQELYLSSTLKELAPVARFDGRAVGGGPLGASLHAAFRALVARECQNENHR